MGKRNIFSKIIDKFGKSFLVKTIILISLILLMITFILLRLCQDFCDFYSKTFVQAYTFVFGHISSLFPFSLFELFLIGTVLYVITWIVFFIRNTKKLGFKKSYHMIMRLGIIVFSIMVVYQGTAGINYARGPVDVPQHHEMIENPKDYKKIVDKFTDDFNYCASQLEFNEQGSVVKPYSTDELISNIQREYEKFDSKYLYKYTSKPKSMYLTGWFYRMASISGVTFVPVGEANFNSLNNDSYLPFTIAHEIAHTKGAMPEEDANLVAAYICLNSEDPYIRYSGYDYTYWSLESLVKATNVEADLVDFYNRLDDNIYRNNNYEYSYWKEHATFEKIAEKINDWYLKFNNDVGTTSYEDNIDTTETETEFKINSYSRFQALYMWIYFDKN